VGPAKDFYYAIQDNIAMMLDEGLSVEETVETMAEELGGLLRQYEQANK
jgi:pilus assembly protein TadC